MKYCATEVVVNLALFAGMFLLLVATIETQQQDLNATETQRPASNWFLSTAAPKKKKILTSAGCDSYGNCTNCFCDSQCWKFDDCCSSYVSNLSGTPGDGHGDGGLGRRLPANTFTCAILPGYFDYNDSYKGPIYVITACPPDSLAAGYVLQGCKRGSEVRLSSSDQFYAIPVTSRVSGLVYRNMYCALCHGERDVTFWRAKTQCTDRARLPGESNNESVSAAQVSPVSDLTSCETVYKSPGGDQPRRCVNSINTCPPDANVRDLNECQRENGTLFVYAAGVPYRNKHCAACYAHPVSTLSCSLTTLVADGRHVQPADPSMSFSVILDLNTGQRFVPNEPVRRQGECPEQSVYDPYAAICRVLVCPTGQVFDDDGVCRPIIESSRNAAVANPFYRTSANLDSELLCPLIGLNESEYTMFDNGSVFVSAYDTLYDIKQYRVDINSSQSESSMPAVIYICSPFTDRNYTIIEDDDQTLQLDEVGGYLSLVCSIISLVALCFQFIVYMSFSVLRNRPGQLILCLISSLFVGQLLFLLVNKSSGTVCYIQAVTMHYSYLAAFLWMNVMSIDVYRTFGTSTLSTMLASPSSGSKRFVGYSLYAWGLAGLIVGVGILLDQLDIGGDYRPHYGRSICWFGSRPGQMVFFATPLGVVLVTNIVLFFGSVVQIHRASKATRVAVQKPANISLLMIYAKLSVVMGLGWMIGFVATFTQVTALWYIFILCNSLQGAFICLAFIVTRQVVRLIREQCHYCFPIDETYSNTIISASSASSRPPPNTKNTLV